MVFAVYLSHTPTPHIPQTHSAPAAADAPAPAAAAPAALGGASELLVGSALESRIDQVGGGVWEGVGGVY